MAVEKNVNFYIKNTKILKDELDKFSNISITINTLKELTNLSNNPLKPKEFYDNSGDSLSNFNLSSELDIFLKKLIKLVNREIENISRVEAGDNVEPFELKEIDTSTGSDADVTDSSSATLEVQEESKGHTGTGKQVQSRAAFIGGITSEIGVATQAESSLSSSLNTGENTTGDVNANTDGNRSATINNQEKETGKAGKNSSNDSRATLGEQENGNGTANGSNESNGSSLKSTILNDTKGNEINIDDKKYIIKNGFTAVSNSNSALFTSGEYPITDIKKDSSGNVIAIQIEKDGKKIWLPVVDNKVVVSADTFNGKYTLNEQLTITVNGQTISYEPGDYEIYNCVYDTNGNVTEVSIIVDNKKLWLQLDSFGKVTGINTSEFNSGVFIINNPNYNMYDNQGNVLGKFNSGQYYIYEVKYDVNGNATEFRLSPNGEYEYWLHFDKNNQDGIYSLFNQSVSNDKKNANLSLFEDSKSLFGLLGVLFVALGTALIIKKKVNKKNYNNIEEKEEGYEEEKWEEETLPTGNYAVYDVRKNKDGLVTDVRITPIDSENEYWVEM